mmetsp:Transcript_5552/g.15515  ORF Transcript_5552/g.15515 Transcript_5552/m.15515 type:complete len:264 (+) Transcript_5552:3101-3892(+)
MMSRWRPRSPGSVLEALARALASLRRTLTRCCWMRASMRSRSSILRCRSASMRCSATKSADASRSLMRCLSASTRSSARRWSSSARSLNSCISCSSIMRLRIASDASSVKGGMDASRRRFSRAHSTIWMSCNDGTARPSCALSLASMSTSGGSAFSSTVNAGVYGSVCASLSRNLVCTSASLTSGSSSSTAATRASSGSAPPAGPPPSGARCTPAGMTCSGSTGGRTKYFARSPPVTVACRSDAPGSATTGAKMASYGRASCT